MRGIADAEVVAQLQQLEQALRTGIREGADYLEIFIEELSDPAYAAAVEKVRNDWKGMQK